ncbi:unnamed protein product [Pararhodospirillum photometricum DSM 122]|uniref:Uncharacterized protein n=1 Tax=Pararhodospirillum photometricum DSM 122 TaxID=1150469 RepID=H6SKB1_PARPM|nr:unnamed protein product [Pararhodospirillum photometricum DSM 122]
MGEVDLGAVGWVPVGQSLTLRGGGEVKSKSRTSYDAVEVTDHALSGEVLFEAPELATYNPWAHLDGYQRIIATRGTRLGERCEVCIYNAQIGKISTRDDNEDWMMTLPFTARPQDGGGDNEVSIRFF